MRKPTILNQLALEGEQEFRSPLVSYTVGEIATEGLVDEVKRNLRRASTAVSGSYKNRESTMELNDKAVESFEKSLRYLKSQLSSARIEQGKLRELSKALKKMRMSPGEDASSLIRNISRRMALLESSINVIKEASLLAPGKHTDKVKKMIDTQKEKLDKDQSSGTGAKEVPVTKKQVLELIDQGLHACVLYRKSRQAFPNKLSATKQISLEAYDTGMEAVADEVVDALKWIFNFAVGVALFIFKLVIGITIIVFAFCNPLVFLFAVGAAVILEKIYQTVTEASKNDD